MQPTLDYVMTDETVRRYSGFDTTSQFHAAKRFQTTYFSNCFTCFQFKLQINLTLPRVLLRITSPVAGWSAGGHEIKVVRP